jgi:ribose 1,5-bisphosphate isomerase
LNDYNPEALISQILDDKIHGANWLSNRSLEALSRIAQLSPSEDSEELLDTITGYAVMIARGRPSMAPIANKLGALVTGLNNTLLLDELRQTVKHRVSELIEESNENERTLVDHCKRIFVDCERVMTFSYSSTVERILLDLGISEAVLTESRPKYEGRELAKALASAGLHVTLGVDSAICKLMRNVDAVIVGADSVLYDGSIVNKVGTYPLALASREMGVHLYSVCDTWKFNVLHYLGNEVVLEEKELEEVAADLKGVEVKNPYFEIVPGNLVYGVITERGLMSLHDIEDKIRQMEKTVQYLNNS